jgi:hypothetical protein
MSGIDKVANIENVDVTGVVTVSATRYAGGLIGFAEPTSLYISNSRVVGVSVSGVQSAGGAIGQVEFGRRVLAHDQTDFYQIYDSQFRGLEIASSAGSAGGIYGSYMVGAAKLSQLHLVRINSIGNTISASGALKLGTVLGYSNAANVPLAPTFGIYGINVYDEQTKLYVGAAEQSYRQAGTCNSDFNLIRFTDVKDLATDGIVIPTVPASGNNRNGVLPDIIDEPANSKYIMKEALPEELRYLLYDSEQSTVLNLTEYITEINRAITSTGVVEGVNVVNTFNEINWYTYESKACIDSVELDSQGNLTWRKYNGSYSFMALRSDEEGQWTNLSVTYNLYDKERDGEADNRPLSVTAVIPVHLELQVSIATQSWIK